MKPQTICTAKSEAIAADIKNTDDIISLQSQITSILASLE